MTNPTTPAEAAAMLPRVGATLAREAVAGPNLPPCSLCTRPQPQLAGASLVLYIARAHTCSHCWERTGGVALAISQPDLLPTVRDAFTDRPHCARLLKVDTPATRRKRLRARLRTAERNSDQWARISQGIALALADIESL